MIDCTAVLIADRVEERDLTISASNFEFADEIEFDEVFSALSGACSRIVTYESPREFLDHVAQHRDDVVISIWSGEHSRNRKALIPSICEAYAIHYVGADTYTNVIAQDKWVSKSIATKFGFGTPPAVLIDSPADLVLLNGLRYPVVTKPNFEGGSIGIADACLAADAASAESLVRTLLRAHGDSVLVEEFVRGREVSYVLVGNRDEMLFTEAVELVLADRDLSETVWSYEIKQAADVEEEWRLVTSEIPYDMRDRSIALFRALGKVELMRIDGRIDERGRFQFIELSPDAYLGVDGAVGAAYALCGRSLDTMLEQLIRNAFRSR